MRVLLSENVNWHVGRISLVDFMGGTTVSKEKGEERFSTRHYSRGAGEN